MRAAVVWEARQLLACDRRSGDQSMTTGEVKPEFPITVEFLEDGERWELLEHDISMNLEWFDSEDPEQRARVWDRLGRPVRLKVERLETRVCELKDEPCPERSNVGE
jgi:hypothetical protein